MGKSTVELLTQLLTPVVESFGCELWGLEFNNPGGKRGMLRIYIDKPEGVNLTDCEQVSRQVSSVLDVEDPIHSEYVLEVSSPGMDRPLYTEAQFKQYIGSTLRVKLQRPLEGRRQFTGLLRGVEKQELVLLIDDNEFLLPLETVDKANLIPQFDSTSNNGKPKKK